jgi:hypothetical protein
MSVTSRSEGWRAAAVVALLFIALPSVVLHSTTGLHVKAVFMASILFSLIAGPRPTRPRNSQTLVVVVAAVAGLTVIAWLWSAMLSHLLLGLTLSTIVALSPTIVDASVSQKSIRFLYLLTVVILVGAWIGSAYSLAGGPPGYCLDNPDGRPNCLYLTTFSNSPAGISGVLMRPSGVFDEPGSLSFFVILVVCLNELTGGGKKRSLVLLSLGLVTLSLAHAICFLAYLALSFRKRIVYVALAAAMIAEPLSSLIDDDSLLSANFLRRFTVEDGQLVGDNRSGQVVEFFSLVDYKICRFGNNPLAKYGDGGVAAVDQSSNPFSIWFGYGLIMWLPYAITLVFLCRGVFQRNRSAQITSVLLLLLLLQRPYIYSLYWGFSIWVTIVAMYLKTSTEPLQGAYPTLKAGALVSAEGS